MMIPPAVGRVNQISLRNRQSSRKNYLQNIMQVINKFWCNTQTCQKTIIYKKKIINDDDDDDDDATIND